MITAEELKRAIENAHGPGVTLTWCEEVLAEIPDPVLPIGEPDMHAHDGIGVHDVRQHHRPQDYHT